MTATSIPLTAAVDGYRFRWHASLNGVRGLAAMSVVLYHTGLVSGFVGGGQVALEVFFVLSGFLITSILRRERTTTGRIRLARFYRRRLRRLYPALIAYVATAAAITLALGWWPVRSSAASSIASATYTMNWAELVISPIPGWFGHMWSLGIEEQFYLVWPLAVLGLSTLGARARWWLAAGLLGTAWLCRVWLIGMHPMVERIRNGTDTRALGFVLGACLALLLERRSAAVERALGGPWAALAGSAGLVVCCFAVKVYSGSMFATWMTAAASASALLIGHCAVNDSRGQRTGVTLALSSPPLVWLGDVSYSLYLWHPLMLEVVARASGSPYPSVARATAGMMASVLFASASYYLVERRFHMPASAARSGPRHRRPQSARILR